MTCIVGLEYKNKLYIGGDSAGVCGFTLSIRSDEKVFINGSFIFGFTTSFRMGQLLRYSFIPPKHPANKDDYQYLVTDFVDAVRTCFEDKGYLKKSEENGESGGHFIVGYRGKLYEIAEDFQVANSVKNYCAVGCGFEIALGSLYSTTSIRDPYKRIELALEASATFSSGVSAPFHILELSTKSKQK